MRRMNGSVIGPRMNSIAAISYSVKFSGTSQYLTLPSSSAFQYGVNNFTLEAWVYRTGVSPNGSGLLDQVIFDHRTISSAQVAILLYYSGSTNKISVYVNGSILIAATSPMLTNTWYHVALVRNSSVSTLYINGVTNGSVNDSNNYNVSSQVVIGGRFADVSSDWYVWQGYLSNVRIVKDIAVYTGNFSVPTAPLTAVQSAGTNISEIPGAQTSLLTCNATTIIDSSVNQFVITNNGDASVIGAFGIWGLDEAFLNTSTSVFSPIASINSSYLVVAGGGGGGGGGGDANFTYSGGGGGAGGLLQGSITFKKSTTYTITVGTGGAGGGGSTNVRAGNNGTDSSIIGSGVSIITIGGGAGGGGAGSGVSTSGGSGGGAGARNSQSQTGSAGTTGQGNSGGNGGGGTANAGGGGGGGAGGAGTSGNSLYSGNIGIGGAGLSIAITGSSVTYAAGGTPTSTTPSYAGSGGSGGGGGTYQSGGSGGAGRDGIVIFAYTTAYGLATATGAYTQTTIGSTDSLGMGAYSYVYSFTGNGTIVFN